MNEDKTLIEETVVFQELYFQKVVEKKRTTKQIQEEINNISLSHL